MVRLGVRGQPPGCQELPIVLDSRCVIGRSHLPTPQTRYFRSKCNLVAAGRKGFESLVFEAKRTRRKEGDLLVVKRISKIFSSWDEYN